MFSDRFNIGLWALALLAVTSGIGCSPEVATNQTKSDQTSANQSSEKPVPDSNAACEAPMLVLKLVESDDVSGGEGAPAPYSSENHSKIILIATVGEPSAQQAEKKELPLVIEEVLRGTELIERGDVVVKDSPDWHKYACLEIPPNAKHFSDGFPPGSSVGVYLTENPDHTWQVADMTSLETSTTRDVKAEWRKEILRFTAVAEAPQADDPAARYKELLPGTTLDQSTFYALAYNRHEAALPHIRQWLIDLAGMTAEERKNSGLHFSSLVELLAGYHDVDSIRPATKVAAALKIGERYPYFEFLPKLCRDANEKTLIELRDAISPMLKELPPESELDYAKDYHVLHEVQQAQLAMKFIHKRLAKASEK